MEIQDDPGHELVFPPLAFPEEPCAAPKFHVIAQDERECALQVIRTHQARIATTVKSIWGRQECGDYLQRLIFDGSDPVDLRRAGFKPEVLDAIMVLLRLHRLAALKRGGRQADAL